MRTFTFALTVAAMSVAAQPAWSEAELEPGLASESEKAESATPATGSVTRSAFATSIVDREPQGAIQTLSNDHRKIYYFTELRGFEEQTITHRWEFQGEPVAEVFFEVRGSRWRVYSSKNLPEDALGEWSVSVVDEHGRVLRTESFLYAAAGDDSAAPEAPERTEPSAAAKPAAPPEPAPSAARGDSEAEPAPPAAAQY